MEPNSSLKQPWKAWYKTGESKDANPLSKLKSICGRGQGSIPQRPRQVDLTAEKQA
ncbi:hypothetical protein QBC33DRAFT_555141 [Phialemonium atrogriseum]|uniref:Uncharacterized protein n=1 Tax=Phialemonium atrogriseum TaxID=1093897 RepID=A0AAJ0CB48_9PEZI|nr:uncharacterized protein QBC33DRAFT_555141 [Phialemonium atrogriseum]KAK1771979.1 hypothetical protein QBC33DRAFT_555141 [Phialemonium atrogriseum]